ncbi:MAG: glycerol-3-phosphate acyltransferase [Bacteroidetes bacterium]|nr:glycerol-3-phosphate acyltransferase [Bacteroidota bacterium]
MFLIYCFAFYLIGSFPTAYILVRYKYKKKITEEGSGNVGARNTLDVTKSRTDGIIVLVTDLLKGLLPSLYLISFSGMENKLMIIPLTLLVAGHNFSPWLKFKGGRGLATGAGVFFAVSFFVNVIWLILYFTFEKFIKNVNVSTVFALIILPVIIFLFPDIFLKFANKGITGGNNSLFIFYLSIAVCFVIILKHTEPLRKWWFGLFSKTN